MKWVTRERPKTDRIACPWLIKNFIDPEAEFLYVPADQVLEVAEREGAHSYDAPDAEYTHRDGLCSFEVLVEEYELDDPALQLLARIVHGADVADDRDATPQSRGLLAVAEGFHLLNLGDHRQLELSLPVYDALYAWCRNEVGGAREPSSASASSRYQPARSPASTTPTSTGPGGGCTSRTPAPTASTCSTARTAASCARSRTCPVSPAS